MASLRKMTNCKIQSVNWFIGHPVVCAMMTYLLFKRGSKEFENSRFQEGRNKTNISFKKTFNVHTLKAQKKSQFIFSFDDMPLPNTKRMQASIQISIAVRASALGELVVTLLKMFTSTRNKVIRRAILPENVSFIFLSSIFFPFCLLDYI